MFRDRCGLLQIRSAVSKFKLPAARRISGRLQSAVGLESGRSVDGQIRYALSEVTV